MKLLWPRSLSEPMRHHAAFWVLAFAFATALLAAASSWHSRASKELAAAELAVRVAEAAHASRSGAAAQRVETATDFTVALPSNIATEPLLHALQRRAAALRLTVMAVQTTTMAPTASTLGREGLNLSVRGSYLGVHRLLAGLDEGDTSPAVLQRLRIQRNAGSVGEVEAQIDLVIFLRAGSANEQGLLR